MTECKECGKNNKSLTEKGLCASCHKEIYKEWPTEFQMSKRERDKLKGIKFKK